MLRAHRKTHNMIWRALAVVIPAIIVISWFARPATRLPDPALLSPPQGAAK